MVTIVVIYPSFHIDTLFLFSFLFWPVAWAAIVNPALWKAEVGRLLELRSSRPAWPTWQKPISTKNTKISQMWWCASVIPATQKAEAGESFEPRRQRMLWAEIMPLHSSLGNRGRLPKKEKKRKISLKVEEKSQRTIFSDVKWGSDLLLLALKMEAGATDHRT